MKSVEPLKLSVTHRGVCIRGLVVAVFVQEGNSFGAALAAFSSWDAQGLVLYHILSCIPMHSQPPLARPCAESSIQLEFASISPMRLDESACSMRCMTPRKAARAPLVGGGGAGGGVSMLA